MHPKHFPGYIPNFPGTWRGSPFTVGMHYRAKIDVDVERGLAAEEQLRYLGASYSHYDGMTVYVFENRLGSQCQWLLYDDEDLERWHVLFETIEAS
jgi:hypothetical protein